MLQRSFWRIRLADLNVVDVDGNTVPAFADVVIYDRSAQFAYITAAQWARPDLAAAGATREDLSGSTRRTRYLRTTVRRPGVGNAPDRVMRVKAANVGQSDEVLESDVPDVLYAGDVADDVVGAAALAEATQRIAAE